MSLATWWKELTIVDIVDHVMLWPLYEIGGFLGFITAILMRTAVSVALIIAIIWCGQ